MQEKYASFLASKSIRNTERGFKAKNLASHLFPFQSHCVDFALQIGCSGLYLDCIAGETKIDGPFGARRIDELAQEKNPILVYSLDKSSHITIAIGSAPFKKGYAKLYCITTKQGRQISVTENHKFLTDFGWLSVSELRHDQSFVVSSLTHLLSNSESSPSKSRPNVPHSKKTIQDLKDHCLFYHHPYDEQPHQDEDIYLTHFPSPIYVPEFVHTLLQMDDLEERSQLCNHHHRSSAHLSMLGLVPLVNYTVDEREFPLHSFGSKLFEPNNCNDEQFSSISNQIPLTSELHPLECHVLSDDPYCISFDKIMNIQYLRTDIYYDFHVPGYENYFAEGILSHNTGLGKTECQLEWCQKIIERTNKPALILTPLAVAWQTQRRAERWGYEAKVIRDQSQAKKGIINICNYERLDKLDYPTFGAVSLDEASIMKSFSGKTTLALIENFKGAQFKLAATATPTPNDNMEFGNYAEFLEVMSMKEMLSRFFINDTSTASQVWRLKGHAGKPFWDWMISWARMAEKPSDLGDKDDAFILPPFDVVKHQTKSIDIDRRMTGFWAAPKLSATEIHDVKRQTSEIRAEAAAKIVGKENDQPWIIWVDTNYEADAVSREIPDAVEIRGSQSLDEKEEKLNAFALGKIKILIGKPSMIGFGSDWSHCARMIFLGRSFSYETWYQAVRRCWRFGQKNKVIVHLIIAECEAEIGKVINRKSNDHDGMKIAMYEAMKRASGRISIVKSLYEPNHQATLPNWLQSQMP